MHDVEMFGNPYAPSIHCQCTHGKVNHPYTNKIYFFFMIIQLLELPKKFQMKLPTSRSLCGLIPTLFIISVAEKYSELSLINGILTSKLSNTSSKRFLTALNSDFKNSILFKSFECPLIPIID